VCIWNPIETIDQIHRRWNIASMDIRNVESQPLGQSHDEPFIDHGMGIVLIRVIRLQDMGRGSGAGGFK